MNVSMDSEKQRVRAVENEVDLKTRLALTKSKRRLFCSRTNSGSVVLAKLVGPDD
jgi:hypothetical protein